MSVETFEQGADYIAFEFSDHESRAFNDQETRDTSPDRDRVKRKKHDYDPNDGYANKKQRTDAASRKAPWVANLDWRSCHHVGELLHKEVEAFTDYISPSPVEHEIRTLIVSLISRAVTKSFPDASIFPFGSFETKLYLPLGDIDLVILSPSMAYNDKTTVLHALANTLKRSGITHRVSIIAKAKVPIVKFVTTHGRFNVDISINQENGILSGKIINGFLKDLHNPVPVPSEEGELQPQDENQTKTSLALRALVLLTKTFLSQRALNEVFTGGLGSYSIVCLAVSFLQMHPKIRSAEIDPDKNLGVLVLEFFELYGWFFNYRETGISVREGGRYFGKRMRGWGDGYGGGYGDRDRDRGRQGCLAIEDPADPSNDIAKGSFAFQKVRQTFAGAFSILSSAAYVTAGILASRRQGRSVRLRPRSRYDDDEHNGDGDAEGMSILSSVLGVTQETINHRKLIQELYDKRVLHDMLGVKSNANNGMGNGNGNGTGNDNPTPASTPKHKSESKPPSSSQSKSTSTSKPKPKSNSKANSKTPEVVVADIPLGGDKPGVGGINIKGAATATATASSSKSHSRSVKTAWHEADVDADADTDHDADYSPPPSHSNKRHHASASDDDSDNEGRYTINHHRRSQPPTKRRRVGGARDAHVMFTTDDEESEDAREDLAYGGLSLSSGDEDREDGEVRSGSGSPMGARDDGEGRDKRRDKGKGKGKDVQRGWERGGGRERERERGRDRDRERERERERDRNRGRGGQKREREDRDKKRSYWLSKGISGASDD